MRRFPLLLSAASLAAAGHAAPPGPETAAATYFVGMDACSPRLLRSAFDAGSTLRWVDQHGRPQRLTQIEWWQRVEAQRPCEAAVIRTLTVLNHEGPLAILEVHASYKTHRFHDLLLTAETPSGWRIVDKVFERIGPDEVAVNRPEHETAIRRVIAQKIAAHAVYNPALLLDSHLGDCGYTQVHVEGTAYKRVELSQAGAAYAARRERGETDHASPWKVLLVRSWGSIAAAKLEVIYHGVRYLDHLLLLRTEEGWRIAAVAWGDPLRGGKKPG